MDKLMPLVFDAWSELASQKLRTLLTLLGMIFGVGAVIAMLNIGEGAEKEALKLIDSMGVNNLIIEVIAKINYSYAITVHLSQSKTYNNVYIDINNILENQNLSEKKKLIYTALTRASNSLKLLIEN